MSRRRRTRVGGDPYNSGELRQALSGYQKVSVPEVCGDPIGRDNLAVWVNQTGKWSQFDTSKLWLKGGPSLCRELVTELGMSSAQYESLRDAFNDDKSTDLVGLYKKGGDYAIVLRVPQTSVLDKLAIGGAAGGGAIAGALTMWAARQNWTQKAKWIEAYRKYASYMYQLYTNEINQDMVPPNFDNLNALMGQLINAQGDAALEKYIGKQMIIEMPTPDLAKKIVGEEKTTPPLGPDEVLAIQTAKNVISQYEILQANRGWIEEDGGSLNASEPDLKSQWFNDVNKFVLLSMKLDRLTAKMNESSPELTKLKKLIFEWNAYLQIINDQRLQPQVRASHQDRLKILATEMAEYIKPSFYVNKYSVQDSISDLKKTVMIQTASDILMLIDKITTNSFWIEENE
jgi:hypothetical protein